MSPLPQPDLRDAANLAAVREGIMAWYAVAHRDFPWRVLDDPYAVLVSEVMLQQTQATRIAEAFPRWMARFPTATSLADAPAADVLAAWSGLGYNRRALALQRTAAKVTSRGWPRDVAALETLPGIGPYTARAVASLAFGERVGVVDTNVRRWLVRRFGATDRARELQALADALAAGPGDPASWTHASMEFGASICRARAPRCDACPIRRGCPARGMVARVPVARQAAYRGSARAYRGTLLRLLATAERPHRLREAEARAALLGDRARVGGPLDDGEWELLVAALEREGLLHRVDGHLGLGGTTAGDTIGP